MQGLRQRVSAVRSRQQRHWILGCLAWGTVIGGAASCLLAALMLAGLTIANGVMWLTAVLLAGPVCGALFAVLAPRSMREAALAIDHQYALKDRISTAWAFLTRQDRTPFQELQIADAEKHSSDVDPRRVAPFRVPRTLTAGVALCIAAVVMSSFTSSPEPLLAATSVNDVVMGQADRVADELEELEQFNQEEPDPEIEEILKELAEKIEELKQPGVDPREALATLSEMQAVLEAKQQELSQPTLDASLQELGDAFTLAEPLEAAGQAMSAGQMEKAAQELEKLELPKLDRQTERALTEKLEKAKQNAGADSALKQFQQAVGQITDGLSQGNRSKFQDGMKGLAGECRSQGRRKKLADLLRKQCQCLSECKGECESECQKTGTSSGKGGKSWGLASSGNELGDNTMLLSMAQEMKLKGQDSNQGDADVETIDSQEEQQQASRQYREKVEKYEQLSESVLDSEPIPLGHRQTIRRYFELIRPQQGEVDAVNEQLKQE